MDDLLRRVRALSAGGRAAASSFASLAAVRLLALLSTLRFSLSIGGLDIGFQRKRPVKHWIAAFEEGDVDAGKTRNFTMHPQCFFRVTNILNLGDIDDLYVTMILVGQRLQIPMSQPIPLRAFNPSVLNDVKWDTCDPALTITVTILNSGHDGARRFSMVVSGDAIV